MTRQQLAGWILTAVPVSMLVTCLFHLIDAFHILVPVGASALTETLCLLIPAGIGIGSLMLAIGLIRNDSGCRLGMALYSAMFFIVGIAVPIAALMQAPEHRGLIILWPIAHPGVLHYALFLLIFFVLFGIPLWLLVRRPESPLFSRAVRKAA